MAKVKTIDVTVQGSWLHRRGLRGRWLTVYVHRYGGQESTERLHSHPWALAFGVVLKGRLLEVRGTDDSSPRWRRLLSIGVYGRKTLHRIEQGDATTVFVGLCRTQARIERAAEVGTAEGFCHYTEIMPNEPGFRPDFVVGKSEERAVRSTPETDG